MNLFQSDEFTSALEAQRFGCYVGSAPKMEDLPLHRYDNGEPLREGDWAIVRTFYPAADYWAIFIWTGTWLMIDESEKPNLPQEAQPDIAVMEPSWIDRLIAPIGLMMGLGAVVQNAEGKEVSRRKFLAFWSRSNEQ